MMYTQLDYKMKTFFKDYDNFSNSKKLDAKVSYLSKKALMTILMLNFEFDLLKQEFKKGNINFSNDNPYPDEYWLEVAGFKIKYNSVREIDTSFRQIMNTRGITNYTPEEAIKILKHTIRNIMEQSR